MRVILVSTFQAGKRRIKMGEETKCEHKFGEPEQYSAGYGFIAYEYTCSKCGKIELYEKDIL